MRAAANPRSLKIALGAATFLAGITLMIVRPGVALAHHVEIAEQASCAGWTTSATYIGGPEDRMVVVDVTINGERISQTFYFDDEAGHLGHQDIYPLYSRAGTGSLVTSGWVKMYARGDDGAYSVLADTDATNVNLQCGPASTLTPRARSTSRATRTPPATETAVPPTATPPATETSVPPTATPPATETSVPPTATPPATETTIPPTNTPEPQDTPEPTSTGTATVVPQGSITPLATNTPADSAPPRRTATPQQPDGTPSAGETPSGADEPESTPTYVDEVQGSTPESQGTPTGASSSGSGDGSGGDTGTALPSAGDGSRTASGLLIGLLGLLLAGSGLGAVAAGIRQRS